MAGRRPGVRRGYLPAESEAAFQAKVLALAGFHGWRQYHPPDNRPSGRTGRVQAVAPGFPDLTLVRRQRLVFAELKREDGKTSEAQDAWIAVLREVADAIAAAVDVAELAAPATAPAFPRPGLEVYVWRPSDWPEIEAALR